MGKTILEIVIGLILFNTAFWIMRIALVIIVGMRDIKKNRYVSPYQSPCREAFIMECSDPNSSSYAKQLDKCIKKMDKEQERIEKIKKKSAKRLSNMRTE